MEEPAREQRAGGAGPRRLRYRRRTSAATNVIVAGRDTDEQRGTIEVNAPPPPHAASRTHGAAGVGRCGRRGCPGPSCHRRAEQLRRGVTRVARENAEAAAKQHERDETGQGQDAQPPHAGQYRHPACAAAVSSADAERFVGGDELLRRVEQGGQRGGLVGVGLGEVALDVLDDAGKHEHPVAYRLELLAVDDEFVLGQTELWARCRAS